MTQMIPKAPSAQHLKKREALLDIALASFIQNGLQQTSVNDIIQNAGIAKGTFYHYFPSKEALILELRSAYIESFFQMIETEMAQLPENAWNRKLHAWFTGSAKHFAAHQNAHNALFHQYHHVEDTQDRQKIIDHLTQFLTQGIQAKVWELESPELAAKLIYHGMHLILDEAHEEDYAAFQLTTDKLYRLFQAMLQPADLP